MAVVAFVFTSPECENVGRWYSYIFVFAGRGSRFVDALPLSGKLVTRTRQVNGLVTAELGTSITLGRS